MNVNELIQLDLTSNKIVLILIEDLINNRNIKSIQSQLESLVVEKDIETQYKIITLVEEKLCSIQMRLEKELYKFK